MQFHYIASKPDRGVVEGDMEASGISELLENLSSRGLRPISVKAAKTEALSKKFRLFGGSITHTDKLFLTKYLALMLKVNTDLFQAIDILIADFDKPALKAFLVEVRGNLEKGQPFYSTFAHYPKFFSPVFVNLIKAGEASGSLERSLEELSVTMDKEQNLRHRVRAATIYPIVLVIASVLITTFLLTFVLPRIATSFLSGNVEPPLFSRIVFALGFFLAKYIVFIFIAVLALGISGWFFFSRTILGKRLLWQFISAIPLIGEVMNKIAIQRFASTLSSLLKAGLPIIDSLEITADVVDNEKMREALIRVSREGVSKGLTLGEAFRKELIFPRTVVNLIAISEKAGHLESILETLSGFYEGEIVVTVSTLISVLEPLLLVAIGIVIGGIALAILVPIYQLASQL